MNSAKGHAIGGGHPRLPLPETIILVLAPFAPLFSHRVWGHAQLLPLGAILAPRARTMTAGWRVKGRSYDHHFQYYHRVFSRDQWLPLEASPKLLGLLEAFVPEGPVVMGLDMPVQRKFRNE